MSDTHHLDRGVGIAKQYTIAELGRVAEAIAKNASFQHLVRSVDPSHGVGAAQVIRIVTGYFDFPGDSVLIEFLNDVFDDFAGKLASLLEKHADDPIEMVKAITPVIDKAVSKANGQEVIIALEQVHKTKECLTVATYVADATPPNFTGKDGKERSNPTRARLLTTTFAEAVKAKKALCPLCYSVAAAASAVGGATEKQEKKDDAPKASVPTLHGCLMAYRKARPLATEPDAFWRKYLQVDGLVKNKLTTAFSQQGSDELIDYFADLPTEQWDPAVNAMLGPQNMAVEGFTRFVARKLGEMGKKAGDRLKAEGEEETRFIKQIGGTIGRANAALDRKLDPTVNTPHEPETPNHWKFAAIVAGTTLLLAVLVYAAHMLG